MRRIRNAKIVATLGPASSDLETVRRLFLAGVDVFRLNFSHGSAADHRSRVEIIRTLERETGRPIGILADLQGPKLRVGTFPGGPVRLEAGARFDLTLADVSGNTRGCSLPHPEIFAALTPGVELLIDDGRVRLRVDECTTDHAKTRVLVGGDVSDRKGVNVPGVVLPISALTPKDRHDLDTALALGADWVALSFVQRPEDVAEVKRLVDGRAGIVSKLEKPAAVERLEEIAALSDAVMVARGDLGVEMPAEQVPAIQKRIVRCCRRLGRPVIVATQMLDSMVASPVPTRAEASDVATAIYDGADAVMLSAESASGRFPVEAAGMMDRIIGQVEGDPLYRQLIDASHTAATAGNADAADAICCAMRHTVGLVHAAVAVTYSSSGATSLRAARERPESPILSLTPHLSTARRLTLAWGIHSVHTRDVTDAQDMVDCAAEAARAEGMADPGQAIVVIAGMPFGTAGTTNLLRIATA
ncbi:pyruvate kinase [Piscinibacter sp.]|uniref:pyruvate kinase n=1 Tax=Piscinibacter sp. TaxID=1903157 RepID=UPI002BDEB697|nr:pyruvate kinase [Albitalea sp.]HUG23990.1 pyruvate kinase [Albitalea sp.]